MDIKGKAYTDRIVRDLRRDLGERIRHVERVAEHAARDLAKLLHGFPQQFATKKDLNEVRVAAASEISDVRSTASDLQIHLIGRERFEAFETNVESQLKTLSAQVGESSGRSTTIIGGAALLVTIGALLFTTLKQSEITHADVSRQINQEAGQILRPIEAGQNTRIEKLERDVLILQQQIAQIKTLDAFFCRTRTPRLPGC